MENAGCKPRAKLAVVTKAEGHRTSHCGALRPRERPTTPTMTWLIVAPSASPWASVLRYSCAAYRPAASLKPSPPDEQDGQGQEGWVPHPRLTRAYMCGINIVLPWCPLLLSLSPPMDGHQALFTVRTGSYSVVPGLPLRKDAGSKRVRIDKLSGTPKTGAARSDLLPPSRRRTRLTLSSDVMLDTLSERE
jgi:hypothetical protein